MNWKDITLDKFYKIQDILEVQDEYTTFNLLDLIYGIDSANMTLNLIVKYSIEFLNKPLDKVNLEKQYTINGTVYDSNFDLTIVNAALFVDYQNYMKEEKPKFEKILSVFFIPVGHKYNDGYDMTKVCNDLLLLDICTIQLAAFFFERQLMVFASLFQYYLTKSLKKMKLKDIKKKQEILEALLKMDLASLVSYRSYSNIVK